MPPGSGEPPPQPAPRGEAWPGGPRCAPPRRRSPPAARPRPRPARPRGPRQAAAMPWPFSESIKKRACRYLLQRYLGHFLQEKLSLEQLSLDLYQGTGSLTQVPLDKWVRDAGASPPRLLLRLRDQLILCPRLPPTLFSIPSLFYAKSYSHNWHLVQGTVV